MPKPTVYEVSPSIFGWVVRLEGDSDFEIFDDKTVAIARARRLAAPQNGAVHVLSVSGHIDVEYPSSAGASG
jgi:hypothetical protein